MTGSSQPKSPGEVSRPHEIVELLSISTPDGYASRAGVTAGTLETLRPGWVGVYFKDAMNTYKANAGSRAAEIVAGTAADHCSEENGNCHPHAQLANRGSRRGSLSDEMLKLPGGVRVSKVKKKLAARELREADSSASSG